MANLIHLPLCRSTEVKLSLCVKHALVALRLTPYAWSDIPGQVNAIANMQTTTTSNDKWTAFPSFSQTQNLVVKLQLVYVSSTPFTYINAKWVGHGSFKKLINALQQMKSEAIALIQMDNVWSIVILDIFKSKLNH